MHRFSRFARLSGMKTNRSPLAALSASLVLLAFAPPASATQPLYVTTITSVSAYWNLGSLEKGGMRYGMAGFYEKNQNGKVDTFAYMAVGICKRGTEGRRVCSSRQSVTDDDHEARFFMDPTMQIATLQLGPHRVQWEAGADTPWVTFYGVACDPDDEDADGPNLGRGAVAAGEMFGRVMSSEDHPMSYGHLSRGAIVTECAFRSAQAPLRN